jgi:hypothetical protein
MLSSLLLRTGSECVSLTPRPQILHERKTISDEMVPWDDPLYVSILEELKAVWKEYDSTPKCISISSNIFLIREKASYLSKVALEGPAMLALDTITI